MPNVILCSLLGTLLLLHGPPLKTFWQHCCTMKPKCWTYQWKMPLPTSKQAYWEHLWKPERTCTLTYSNCIFQTSRLLLTTQTMYLSDYVELLSFSGQNILGMGLLYYIITTYDLCTFQFYWMSWFTFSCPHPSLVWHTVLYEYGLKCYQINLSVSWKFLFKRWSVCKAGNQIIPFW